ncbi:hypothetical protein BKA70DRAFT_1233429 [Coprinopsis sp. MPI-PUGE-AT-0042]|nr:hypothetical protein BKA70DRAFT_1233429 [Coprinopsis sp. MPI-PUGE-AT-0042]
MVRLRSLSGPPAGEWIASLRLEIVYHVIDQLDPFLDLDVIKSLTLTCRELKSYCRPMVFDTIDIGPHGTFDSSPPPAEKQTKASESLRPDFIKEINVFWIPVQGLYAPGDNSRCCEAEALFSFVLDRPFPAVKTVTISTQAISFKDLSPGVQHSLLVVTSAPKLVRLCVGMSSFPNTLLEQGRHVHYVATCGDIYSDPQQPQIPFAIDPSATTPRSLHMAHVSEESLQILAMEHPLRFDTTQVRDLTIEKSITYSAGHDGIVRNSAASLVALILRIRDWEESLFFLPLGDLPNLMDLELIVTTDRPSKFNQALNWLNTSAARRSSSPNVIGLLTIRILLSMRFIPGYNITKVDVED